MYLLLNKPKSFEWQVLLLFHVINDKKLSSHMAQISEQINYPNKKIHSYNQMRKMIIDIGSKKGENNDTYSPQITRLQNSLLMIIADTPAID